MTASVDTQLADHHARIVNVEKQQADFGRKLDRITMLVITTLIAALGGVLAQVLNFKH